MKDAAGNNITDDFGLGEFTVTSSDEGKVDSSDLSADAVGYAVVSLTYDENEDVKTGLVTINVFENLSIYVDKLEVAGLTDNTVYLDESTETGSLVVEVKDQDNGIVDTNDYDKSFKSSNPAVISVDESGNYTAIKAGTATITVTVETIAEGLKATKTYVMTVKEERYAKTFEVATGNVSVSNKDGEYAGVKIFRTLKVLVKDQYGNPFNGEVITAFFNTAGGTKITIDGQATANGGYQATATSGASGQDGYADFIVEALTNQVGTVKVDFTAANISGKKSASVKAATPVASDGYAVEQGTLELDSNPKNSNTTQTTTVGVYAKDRNGLFIDQLSAVDMPSSGPVAAGKFALKVVGTEGIVQITSADDEVKAVDNKLGKQSVNVHVGTGSVKTLAFNVTATSDKFASKIVLAKPSIDISADATPADVTNKLFDSNGVLNVTNPSNKSISVKDALTSNGGNLTYDILSNNSGVFNKDTLAVNEGTTTITIVVTHANGVEVFVVEVVVE